MIPLGLYGAAQPVASGGPVVLAHDVFDCNTAHTLAAHVTAGHPTVGAFTSNHGNARVNPTTDALYFDTNATYYGRQLANVGTAQVVVTANLIGRVTSGSSASDRHYGLGLGLPVQSNSDGINGLMYYLTHNGTLTGGQITSAGWAPPTTTHATGITMSDDMIMSVALNGLDVTVKIDGNTVYTTTLSTAPNGTYAGAGQLRAQWNDAVGYKWIKVEEV